MFEKDCLKGAIELKRALSSLMYVVFLFMIYLFYERAWVKLNFLT